MDKTNVNIKIPGRLLSEHENLIDINEERLLEQLINVLQSRKKLVNVSFQPGKVPGKKSLATITRVEVLLSDENGSFNYYED